MEVIISDKRVYVERREEGDYAVRKGCSERAGAEAPTQKEAIEIAKSMNSGVTPHVERVRNTSEGSRDKWRKP
jgi:hypothetical protein